MANSPARRFWETFGIAAGGGALAGVLVSAAISGIINFYSLSVLETRKARAEEVVRAEAEWDNAQANIFAQLAVFNNNLLDSKKNDSARRESLLQSVVKTQFSLVRLQEKLQLGDQESVKEYNEELAKLSAIVRGASKIDDVGQILASSERLFELHDEVDKLVDAKTDLVRF